LVKALRYRLEGRGFDLEFFTMAPGPIQPLTEKNTRNISWGQGSKCGQGLGLTKRLHVMILLKSGSVKLLETSGLV
jgi:hypothetical protein